MLTDQAGCSFATQTLVDSSSPKKATTPVARTRGMHEQPRVFVGSSSAAQTPGWHFWDAMRTTQDDHYLSPPSNRTTKLIAYAVTCIDRVWIQTAFAFCRHQRISAVICAPCALSSALA